MVFHFMKNPDMWNAFFTKYQDRILFGTDSNTYKDFNKEINELVYTFLVHDSTEFRMPCYGNHLIRGIGLDEKTVEKICYTNYLDFIGGKVKPVDKEKVYNAAGVILKEIYEMPNPYYEKAKGLFEDDWEEWSPEQKTAREFFEEMLQ